VVAAHHPESGVMTVAMRSGRVNLETPLVDASVGDAVRIAIRAGDILLAAERPTGLSARNIVPGTIASLRRTGAFVTVHVSVGAIVEVHVTPTACEELDLREGRDVWLVIKTHSCRAVAVK
jgi:molybdate transport system ATP-binding protein